MTPKQRNAIFQHWRSEIMRETRDLASLEQTGARALADGDVRADAELQSLVRAHLEQRRAELERERHSQEVSTAAQKSGRKVRRDADIGWRTTPTVTRASQPEVRSVQPTPIQPTPNPVQVAFDQLAQTLSGSLARGDEVEAQAVAEQMRALQQESGGVISAAALEPYEQQGGKLRTELQDLREQVAALAQQAVAASGQGDEPDVARLMRRLYAIHVTHPRLLDKARLGQIRADIVQANEQHEDGLTARKLVERERAVAAEIKRVAAAVHEFHRVVCAVPHTSAEFRAAEAAYLRTLLEVRAYDTEWLTGFVLELADLLAEWSKPSRGAGKQIDHFLESVRLSLNRIHAEMGEIDTQRGGPQGSCGARGDSGRNKVLASAHHEVDGLEATLARTRSHGQYRAPEI